MGLAKGAAKILLKESIRRPFTGKVLVLGKQFVYFSQSTLQEIANALGVTLSNAPVHLSHRPDLAESGYISDESFLLSLGFSKYAALDFSDYESCDHIFDLNQPETPTALTEAFDLIVDSGTIEHVFHLPNALQNIFRMLKPNGRIIHLAPSSNYIDHGFYMFSPTLFWDFYAANKFQINTFQMIRHTVDALIDPWEASDYRPGCLDQVAFGGLDDAMYAILCIATKTEASTGNVVPQQTFFMNVWNSKPAEEKSSTPVDELVTTPCPTNGYSPSSYERIKGQIREIPLLYTVLRIPFRVARSFRSLRAQSISQSAQTVPEDRKRGLQLEIVDRY